MKKIIFILAVFFIAACNNSDSTKTINNSISKTFDSNCVISIEGMSCQKGCASSIERELSKIDGIALAKVDFADKSAVINYESAKTGVEQIILAIEEIDGGKFQAWDANEDRPVEINE